MKSILLHIRDDGGQDARIRVALDVARALDGHLRCVQPVPFPAYYVADPTSFAATPTLIEEVDRSAREFRQVVEARLAREAVPWDWFHVTGDAATTILSQSRLADVIVLSGGGQGLPAELLSLVSDVALHARTPVLAVPQRVESFDPGGPAMVAWNGSHEAANALRASIPLLKQSEAVHVVAIGEQGEDFSTEEACRYLAHHGLLGLAEGQPRGDKLVAETLVEIAGKLEASYVVLGAYGHSRLRELLIGGVTRWMLEHSPLPLLLAH